MTKKLTLSVVAAIIVAVGAYWFFTTPHVKNLDEHKDIVSQAIETPSSTTTPVASENASLKQETAYINSEYGFAFRYPSEYLISTTTWADEGVIVLVSQNTIKHGERWFIKKSDMQEKTIEGVFSEISAHIESGDFSEFKYGASAHVMNFGGYEGVLLYTPACGLSACSRFYFKTLKGILTFNVGADEQDWSKTDPVLNTLVKLSN